MKTYKLNGLDIYIVNVFSIEDAVAIAWLYKIGVTKDNLTLTDYKIESDMGVAFVCRSYEELKEFM